MEKKEARLRRARQTRAKINEQKTTRLAVHKTNHHIYAQIISAASAVLTSASTLDTSVRKNLSYGGNIKAASLVGKLIAEKAKKIGIEQVAFDRSGFKYHGRVKALADAAREHGLKF